MEKEPRIFVTGDTHADLDDISARKPRSDKVARG